MMMGLEEDPENGGAVAASIFIAVAVYAVSTPRAEGDLESHCHRACLYSAVSKHGSTSGRVAEGQSLYDND